MAVGDVSPNRDDPPSIFRYCVDTLRQADIRFGQMESPLSDRGLPQFFYHAPCRLRPHNVSALTKEGANFDVMSFACNHATDYGWEAFYDTLDILKKNNIPVIGAGRNIVEARKPFIIEKKGTKVGFLSYLNIIVPGLTAEEDIPGCTPLRSNHGYEWVDVRVGSPPRIVTELLPEDKQAMEEDIKKLRPQVDVLVVCVHAGVTHVPALIAMCQKEAAHAAVDAGADLVIQHHAHILKGIEVYQGKVIFYGLGHFAIEHQLPFPGKLRPWDVASRKLRRELYHQETIPGYEKHPFHFDALKTMIAKAYIQNKKIEKVTYIPCYITPNLEPEVINKNDPRGWEIFHYVKDISKHELLNVNFAWDGDEVQITG